MSEITCSGCTIEEKVRIFVDGLTPTGRPKKKTITQQVPTPFNGTEEEALEAGWTLDEYGFLCPSCQATKTAAEAEIIPDPADGSSLIHLATGQLSAQQIRDAHIVSAAERGHVLDRLWSSNRPFEVFPDPGEGGFIARFLDQTSELQFGKGANVLVALFDLQESMGHQIVKVE